MTLSNSTLSHSHSWKNQIVGILAILLLISGGVELTVYTLQLEHSCPPLLQEWWSNNSAPQCSPLVAEVPQPQTIPTKPDKPKSTLKTNESKNSNDPKQTSNQIAQKPTQKPENFKPKKESKSESKQSDIVGKNSSFISTESPIETQEEENKSSIDPKEVAAIALGSTAMAVLAILEIPLVVAAGAGAAIWVVAKALIDLSS